MRCLHQKIIAFFVRPRLSLNIQPDVQNWNVGCPPQQTLKPLISSVVSLAQLVSSSVALLAELVLLSGGPRYWQNTTGR